MERNGLSGCFSLGDFQEGRHEIDDVAGKLGFLARLRTPHGPVEDTRRADAAFVHPGFVATEGGIGDAGPG